MSDGTLGEKLRAARVARGLDLRELARQADIAPSYLSDIECDRRVPSEQVLASLCATLDLDFDETLAAAGRLGDEDNRYLLREPAARMLIRRAQESNLGDRELRNLITQVDRMAGGERKGK